MGVKMNMKRQDEEQTPYMRTDPHFENHDLNSGCSVGDDSTAPPSGRLSPPNPGPQQYCPACEKLG